MLRRQRARGDTDVRGLIIRAGAELLRVASSDPRSEEGYEAVKANISEAWKG